MSNGSHSEAKTEMPNELIVSTQAKPLSRKWQSEWIKQLPRLQFEAAPNPEYQLIDKEALAKLMADVDPASSDHIIKDIEFLDENLLPLFRQRDYEASLYQNNYRLVQISFMVLAAVATAFGAFQGLSLTGTPNAVPILAFIETVVALLTAYIATVNSREDALPSWLKSRQSAETLRREYFRYLMRVAPYDKAMKDYERKKLLSTRAALINQGKYPEEDQS